MAAGVVLDGTALVVPANRRTVAATAELTCQYFCGFAERLRALPHPLCSAQDHASTDESAH